jgi:hypothetical protein
MADERNTRIKYNQIASIRPSDVDAINSALDGQVPSFDEDTGKFNWVDASKDFVWQDPVESEGQIDPDLLEDFYATGGTITQVGDDNVHTFTANGTLTVTGVGIVEVLIVGGGGGGGSSGGGGGGGGVKHLASYPVSAGEYAIVVGTGGGEGTNGGDSSFNSILVYGGGGGAGDYPNSPGDGKAGGSGGGGSWAYGPYTAGGAGVSGQGHNGGAGGHGWQTGGGGGGGAASVGGNAYSEWYPDPWGINIWSGGIGGDGLPFNILGILKYYGGGGGGGSGNHIFSGGQNAGGSGGPGGLGGGNGGSQATDTNPGSTPTSGQANTGGGGGGGGSSFNKYAAGADGVVIVRYRPLDTSEIAGKRFIIGIEAVHSWEGHDQEIATSLSDKTHWSFVAPEVGMIAYVVQESKYYYFNGINWAPEAESLSAIQDSDGTTKIEAFSEYIKFTTNGSERMRILSTGKVGIGLDSPLEALQVTGNIRLSGTITDGTNSATPADIASAISLKHSNSLDHSRQHSITSSSDHTSSATSGYILKADANGLPITATNTDSDVSDAVSKKHSNSLDHSQGTDTTLGAMTADINANSHQVTGLAAPDANGEAIRATTKITETALEDAIDKKHSNSLDHTQNTDIGSSSNTFDIGNGVDTDKSIRAANGDANKPELRYSAADNKWQFSNNGVVFTDIGAGSSTGEALVKSINQSTHGFVAGDVLKFTGGVYAKAKADTAANAEVIGIVSEATTENSFKILTSGYIDTLTGLTANTLYFLSDATAGLLTATEPTTEGSISKPVLYATSTTAGYFINYRGAAIASTSSYYLSFVNATLAAGILTITHNLGHKYCAVTIADNSDKVIVPDEVTYTDANTVTVDLTSYGTITGTWRAWVLDIGSTTTLPISTDGALGSSDALVPSQKAVKTYADTKLSFAFVNRNAGGYDYTISDMGAINGFRTLDISAIVPAGAKVVHMLVIGKSTTVGDNVAVRNYDNTGNSLYNCNIAIPCIVANVQGCASGVVPCSSDRKVSVYRDTNVNVFSISILGWFI